MKDLMLHYYLEEGQPGVTNRLAHGDTLDGMARIKGLRKILKKMDKQLGDASGGHRGCPRMAQSVPGSVGGGVEAVRDGKACSN
jgi:hypothetical protein